MSAAPNTQNLDHYWMPFTANRQFKKAPRILESAQGMYYRDVEGNQILDGAAGLWCVNAGHGRPEITEAVARQLERLDYSPAFQMGHTGAFEFAERLAAIAPGGAKAQLDRIFFTNSGSEAVDTALKIAHGLSARHRPGHPHAPDRARARLSRRGLWRHFRGRPGQQSPRCFPSLPGAEHLRHTHDPARNLFSRGLPEHGAELADDLETAGGAAWRRNHRRGDRRAGGGFDRRAAAAQRLSGKAAQPSPRSMASC